MKSLRFLERSKRRKAMEVTKVRRKSRYPMGRAKCMRVRRTGSIHGRSSISGHVNNRCGRLIRCMRRDIINRRGKLRYQGGMLRYRNGILLRKNVRERIDRGNR